MKNHTFWHILNLGLFVFMCILFLMLMEHWAGASFKYNQIQKSLEIERQARERLTERVLAAEKRPEIVIKYGSVISTTKDIIIEERVK